MIKINDFLSGVCKNKSKSQKGFTLIELLVVIAIIGLLATIVLVALNSARVKARDARRQSDIRQISLAMEMWYDSNNFSYCLPGPGTTNCNWANTYATVCSGAIGSFMLAIPTDPGGRTYYCSDAGQTDGQTYCAWVRLENSSSYVLSNKNGTKIITTVPSSLATCNQ